MTEETQGLIPCIYTGCKCLFVTEHDLNLHLRAFSYRDAPMTREIHLDLWHHELARRTKMGE
jgi:hypothetical protein